MSILKTGKHKNHICLRLVNVAGLYFFNGDWKPFSILKLNGYTTITFGRLVLITDAHKAEKQLNDLKEIIEL